MNSESAMSPSLIRIAVAGKWRTTPDVGDRIERIFDWSGSHRARRKRLAMVGARDAPRAGAAMAQRQSVDPPNVVDDLAVVGELAGAWTATSPRSLVTSRMDATIPSPGGASAARLDVKDHPVGAARIVDDEPRSGDPGMARDDLRGPLGRDATNMPFTFVVWSARPSHPLMRMFVRPHGEVAGKRSPRDRRCRSGSAGSHGVCSSVHHDLADLARRDRVAGAGTHDLDQHPFVDDQALARLGFIGDRSPRPRSRRPGSAHSRARPKRRASSAETLHLRPAPFSRLASATPSSSALSRMIFRNDGVPT